MKVKGICKDCKHRWQYGAKGQAQHLWCTCNGGRVVKNTNMKDCKYHEPADKVGLRYIRLRSIQGK